MPAAIPMRLPSTTASISGRVRAPTLILHGDFDFIPMECAEHIAQAIPGARLAVLPDSGHFSYIDAPDQVRHALDRFFARPPSAA